MSAFQRATRHSVKARIALTGPSGSGKTYTALSLASALANGGRVACIDTEKGSASLYADEFDFDVLELGPPFHPQRYVDALKDAERAGYSVVIVDSLSHAWFDEGGVLDIVDQSGGGNKFKGWQKGTPAQNTLINAVVRSGLHVVATLRTKTEYALSEDGKRITKLGLAPIQRDGVDYEFSVVGEMSIDHVLTITKSRFKPLQDRSFRRPGPEVAAVILAELGKGESVEAPPAGTEAGERGSSDSVRVGATAEHASAASTPRDTPAQSEEPQRSRGAGTASASTPRGSSDPPIADRNGWKADPTVGQKTMEGQKATQQQLKKMGAIAGEFGWDDDERHRQAGIDTWSKLSKVEASWLIEAWSAYLPVFRAEQEEAAERAAAGDGPTSASAPPDLLAQAKSLYHGALLKKARLISPDIRSEKEIPESVLRELVESNL